MVVYFYLFFIFCVDTSFQIEHMENKATVENAILYVSSSYLYYIASCNTGTQVVLRRQSTLSW